MLGTIARLYVEAKTQDQKDHDFVSVGQEFDTCLTALGLAPPIMDDGEARLPASAPMAGPGQVFGDSGTVGMGQDSLAAMNQTMQLGNWFSGNQYMMGLLEEDLEIFKGLH